MFCMVQQPLVSKSRLII